MFLKRAGLSFLSTLTATQGLELKVRKKKKESRTNELDDVSLDLLFSLTCYSCWCVWNLVWPFLHSLCGCDLWPYPTASSRPTLLSPIPRSPPSIRLVTGLHRDLQKTSLPSIHILKGFYDVHFGPMVLLVLWLFWLVWLVWFGMEMILPVNTYLFFSVW